MRYTLKSTYRILARFKPGVPKRYLLLVTAVMWFVAGMFLFYRGDSLLTAEDYSWVRIMLAIVAGMLMFILVFIRISIRQVKRIHSMAILKPCIFSFFNLKGYLMMGIMIALGVVLRSTMLISAEQLAYLYIAMGIPLLLSSARFFLAWRKYDALIDS